MMKVVRKLNFTYIGNYQKKFFSKIKLVKPIAETGKELKNHHIYITGSLNEPSGNHHVEAGLVNYLFYILIVVA